MYQYNRFPIIHDSQFAFKWMREKKSNSKLTNSVRYIRPHNLSIYTAHNYETLPVFEECLQFHGLNDYKVDVIKSTKWSNTLRIREFIKYLTTECNTDYILFCDADDVVICDQPSTILTIFLNSGADLLYGSTRFKKGYLNMPDVFNWANRIHKDRYLNGGVFIGKKDFVIEVYQRVLDYVTDDDVSSSFFYNNESKFSNNFPNGIGSDQTILRYLEPEFYPRLQIDINNKLVFRNENRSSIETFLINAKKSIYKVLYAKNN